MTVPQEIENPRARPLFRLHQVLYRRWLKMEAKKAAEKQEPRDQETA